MELTLTPVDQLALVILWITQVFIFLVASKVNLTRAIIAEDKLADLEEQKASNFRDEENLCPSCNGTGCIERSSRWVSCPRCVGSKTVWIKVDKSQLTKLNHPKRCG